MSLSPEDYAAIWLSLKLATWVTVLLLIIAIPAAYHLARTKAWYKAPVSALIALPMVLPPTVLGFYLLIFMGPNGPLGAVMQALDLPSLAFSFPGLVIASMCYSLPFVVQPIQNAFEAMGKRPLELAATLGASPLHSFFRVALPLAKPGIITAATLGFAHTLGEFGVVLMIGGNIPEETRVVSVQLYEHVELFEYANAHALAAVLMVFAFAILLALFSLRHRQGRDMRLGLF